MNDLLIEVTENGFIVTLGKKNSRMIGRSYVFNDSEDMANKIKEWAESFGFDHSDISITNNTTGEKR